MSNPLGPARAAIVGAIVGPILGVALVLVVVAAWHRPGLALLLAAVAVLGWLLLDPRVNPRWTDLDDEEER